LRFGTAADIQGRPSMYAIFFSRFIGKFLIGLVSWMLHRTWKHWGCVSSRVLANIKKFFPDPADLDGYEDLKPEDQQKIKTAYEAGHVAEEDIPETAKKPAGEGDEDEEEEKPKKKGGRKRKADDEEGGEEEKPKKKAGGRAKVCL
jgi:hypothetical protein